MWKYIVTYLLTTTTMRDVPHCDNPGCLVAAYVMEDKEETVKVEFATKAMAKNFIDSATGQSGLRLRLPHWSYETKFHHFSKFKLDSVKIK